MLGVKSFVTNSVIFITKNFFLFSPSSYVGHGFDLLSIAGP